jgi:hypothetical protein
VAAFSSKALESTPRALALYEQHSQQEVPGKAASHRAKIAHDRLLARRAGKYRAQSQNIGLLWV